MIVNKEFIQEFKERCAELYDRALSGTDGKYYYFSVNPDKEEISDIQIAVDANRYGDDIWLFGTFGRITGRKEKYIDEMTKQLIFDLQCI